MDIESAEQRGAYLSDACAADPALRQRVDALLAAYEQAGSFLDPARPGLARTVDIAQARLREAPGTPIGPYKLLEQIGEGGMGVVFLAEQQHPVRRQVALKVIKAGMDTTKVIARFEAERQALALMDHPNIARVFDAGTTDSGRPYFVMELVKGVSITKYCDDRQLRPRQRLELLVQVCHAVQHAHQKGIIHRDLKPSNVLIALYDGKPVPKVIDFGVAKATGPRLIEQTMFTGFGDVIGTLEYMSPEQAELNQLDVDTRSDIYSLGVLLYELLTGSTPLEHGRVVKAGLVELLRVVREEEPPKPSMRLSTTERLPSIAASRGVEPKKLSGLVKDELDWIVMKSLEKDRNRRYETANGMASDIRRYLNDEAVHACPPSAKYRFRKFARRNKGPVAASTAVLVVLVAGVTGTTIGLVGESRQRAIAESRRLEAQSQEREKIQQAAVARAVSRFQADMFTSADPDKMIGDKVTVLQAVTAAVKELDAGKLNDQPLVEASVRQTIGMTLRELGSHAAAEPNLHKALELRRSLLPAGHPDIATSLNELAVLRYVQRRLPEAEALDREALQIRREALPAGDPAIAISLSNLASDLHRQNKLSEAEPLFREALDIYRKCEPSPNAHIVNNLGDLAMLLMKQGKLAESERMVREVMEINQRTRPPGHPDVAWSLTLLGSLSAAQGKHVQAEQFHREALDLFRHAMPAGHPRIAWSLNFLATELCTQGKLSEAEQLSREALKMQRAALPPGHPDIALSIHLLASTLRAGGRPLDAEPLDREALEIFRKAWPAGHPDVFESLDSLELDLRAQDKVVEAEAVHRELVMMTNEASARSGQPAEWNRRISSTAPENQSRGHGTIEEKSGR
jgi:serine/threonine protein kinase/tetratricopeptide (TPR) repeat protein